MLVSNRSRTSGFIAFALTILLTLAGAAGLQPLTAANAVQTISKPADEIAVSRTAWTNVCTSSCDLSGFNGDVKVIVWVAAGKLRLTSTTSLNSVAGYSSSNWTSGNSNEIGFYSSQSAANAAIETLQFQATGDSTVQLKISAIDYTAGTGYDPATGHFYEIVNSPSVRWEDARCRALYGDTSSFTGSTSPSASDRSLIGNPRCSNTNQRRTMNGLNGYLANITSIDEQTFLKDKLTGRLWIGGSDHDENLVWKWVDGPESGQQFLLQGTSALRTTNNFGGAARFNYFSDGEPNGSNGSEDFAEYGFGNAGIGGSWNDCQNTCGISQFLVEYGGSGGTATTVETVFNVMIRVAPAVALSSAPTYSGTLTNGTQLTSAVTFTGAPAPTKTYQWQSSSTANGTYSNISGATNATFTATPSEVGKYLRVVVVGTNYDNLGTAATATGTSTVVGPVALTAPATPTLATSSDSGSSSSDKITNDNSPTIGVASLVSGASLTVTATKGSTTKTCVVETISGSTTGCTFDTAANPAASPPVESNTLSDGTWVFTASQSLNGQTASALSSLTSVVIDTVGPTAESVSVLPSLSSNNLVTVTTTFSENLGSHDPSKFLASLSSVAFTKSNYTSSGSTVSYDLSFVSLVTGSLLFTADTGAATDIAGNSQTVAFVDSKIADTVAPAAAFASTPLKLEVNNPTSITSTLTFSRAVWGLTTSDLSLTNNTSNCSIVSLSPSSGPASAYSVRIDCSGSDGGATLTLAADSVKDHLAVSGPATPLVVQVVKDTQVLPSFTIGTLGNLGAIAGTLAPNFDLSLNGGSLSGVRVTDLNWSTSGTTKDEFSFTHNSSTMSSLGSFSCTNGVCDLSLASNATEAQWEAAIRAIQFDAGSNSGTRNFEFHLKPVSTYSFETQHWYKKSAGATSWSAAQATSAHEYYAGVQGYLANITSADENAIVYAIDSDAWFGLKRTVDNSAASDSSFSWQGGPSSESGKTPVETGFSNFEDNANDSCITFAPSDKWDTQSCSSSYYAVYEYGGMESMPSTAVNLKQSRSITIDAIEPKVLSVQASSANGTYIVGETVTISVTMDDATVIDPTGGTPRISLNVTNANSTTRYATYSSGSGTSTLTFSYTVQAGDSASDLNYAATNSLTANSGTLRDAAGNNATLTLPATNSASLSLAGNSAVVINADLFVPATFSLGTLPAIGPNVISIAPNFNLTVRRIVPVGFKITNIGYNASASTVDTFATGTLPSSISLASNSNGALELSSSSATEADWETAIRGITLDAGSDSADRSLQFHMNPGNSYSYATASPAYISVANYVGDLTGPTISNVSGSSANGTYLTGDTVNVLVTFTEAISVSGTPQLDLNLGANTRSADCIRSSANTSALVCSYTIAQGDTSSDLNYSSATALELNGGSVTDAPGNAAILTLPGLTSAGSLASTSAIVVDGNAVALRLAAASATSSSSSISFVVTSNIPINCSTISTTIGTDFDATGIRSIDSVTASNANKTCTIAATSSVVGLTAASTLTEASSFSIDNRQNPPVVVTHFVTGANSASVDVTVSAAIGQGQVNSNTVAGTPRTIFTKSPPSSVFSALSAAAKSALKNSSILEPADGLPSAVVEGDFSQAGSTRIDAKKSETIAAGSQLQAKVKIDTSSVAIYEALAFFKSTIDPSNPDWVYLGKRDFDPSGLVATDPMVFARRGTYFLNLVVVLKSNNFSFATVNSPDELPRLNPGRFKAAAYTNAQLPVSVQSLEVVVNVNGTEPTVNEPTAQSSSSSGSSSAPTVTPPPAATPEPAPPVKPTPAPSVKPSKPVAKPTPKPKPSVKPKPVPTSKPEPSLKPTKPAPTKSPEATKPDPSKPGMKPSGSPTAKPSATAAPKPSATAAPKPAKTPKSDQLSFGPDLSWPFIGSPGILLAIALKLFGIF